MNHLQLLDVALYLIFFFFTDAWRVHIILSSLVCYFIDLHNHPLTSNTNEAEDYRANNHTVKQVLALPWLDKDIVVCASKDVDRSANNLKSQHECTIIKCQTKTETRCHFVHILYLCPHFFFPRNYQGSVFGVLKMSNVQESAREGRTCR